MVVCEILQPLLQFGVPENCWSCSQCPQTDRSDEFNLYSIFLLPTSAVVEWYFVSTVRYILHPCRQSHQGRGLQYLYSSILLYLLFIFSFAWHLVFLVLQYFLFFSPCITYFLSTEFVILLCCNSLILAHTLWSLTYLNSKNFRNT